MVIEWEHCEHSKTKNGQHLPVLSVAFAYWHPQLNILINATPMDPYTLRISWGIYVTKNRQKSNAAGLRHTTCSGENLRVEHVSQAILFWAIRPPQYEVAEPTTGDNGKISRQVAGGFLFVCHCAVKVEKIGLIETYHGNYRGETNSNYHDARVQHLSTNCWTLFDEHILDCISENHHGSSCINVHCESSVRLSRYVEGTPKCCKPVGAANIMPDTHRRSGYFILIE